MTRIAPFVLAVLIALAVGCGKSTPTPTSPSTPAPGPQPVVPPGPGPGPAPTDGYELDPTKHVIPATPATGKLAGKTFTPDRVELEGNRLTIRQGKEFFADMSVEINFDQKAKPSEGIKLVVKPTQKWSDGVPTLLVSARSDKSIPETKFVNDGYAMTLELGKAVDGKSAGKIYLSMPDSPKGGLVGTFVAQRKRSFSELPGADEIPFIQGSVTPPLKKGQSVSVGYVGLPTGGGNVISDGAGGQLFGDDGSGGGVRSTTFTPRTASVRFEKFIPQFDFTNLPPGRYLLYARVKDGPAAWNWVDVAASAKVTADIKLDGVMVGTVEVKLPPGESDARLVPTELGTPPPGDRFIDQLAFSLDLDAEAKDGVATIKNVPAGKYQVRAGRLRGTVDVLGGKTATVELKAEKK